MIKKMKKTMYFLVILVLLSGCAQLTRGVFAPSEIEQYCRKILGNSNDPGAVNTCMQQEYSAKSELSRMAIPPDIEKRCRLLSSSTGGSYQVMLTCVQQEMPSMRRGK